MEIRESVSNYIVTFDNVVPNKVLNSFYKYCKYNTDFTKAQIIGEKKDGSSEIINENVRNVSSLRLDKYTNSLTQIHWANLLNFTFSYFIKEYQIILNMNNIGFKITNIDLLKYQKEGHYSFHVDDCEGYHRTFSCILLINDEYEGGDLFFKNVVTKEITKINKVKNRIIIWPSNFLFPHKISPVTKGERFSVVAWAV